jgi:hypothetical protein
MELLFRRHHDYVNQLKTDIMKRRIIISVLLTLSFAMAQAQNINVGGTVTDSQGYALPGVSVIVKGTKTGVDNRY